MTWMSTQLITSAIQLWFAWFVLLKVFRFSYKQNSPGHEKLYFDKSNQETWNLSTSGFFKTDVNDHFSDILIKMKEKNNSTRFKQPLG